MKDLTDRQKEILIQIKAYKQQYGSNPNIAWLAKAFNMAGTSMNDHLTRLERKGYVKRTTVISEIEVIK